MTHVRESRGKRRSSRIAANQENEDLEKKFYRILGSENERKTKLFQIMVEFRENTMTEARHKLWERFEDKFKNTELWKQAEKDWEDYVEEKMKQEDDNISDYEIDDDDIPNQSEGGVDEQKTGEGKKAPEEEEKKKRVGGKLNKVIDSQIDNHVLVSALVTVNNHAFSTILQYLESELRTPINKVNNIVEYKSFGWACHFCHMENEDLISNECQLCRKQRNLRYYKMEKEYT